jgi:hypothetical protein
MLNLVGMKLNFENLEIHKQLNRANSAGVLTANVGIAEITVAETLAKKCHLFMWCLILVK